MFGSLLTTPSYSISRDVMKPPLKSSLLLCLLATSLHSSILHSNTDYEDTQLVFANRKDISIINQTSKISNLLTESTDAVCLDFLYIKNEGLDNSILCWTENSNKTIRCANMSNLSHTSVVVTSGLDTPDGLAIDWITNKLYWVDSATSGIEVCELDSCKHRKVLFSSNIDKPRSLALDPRHGYMYWLDWGDDPKIERAGMNGEQATRKVLVNDSLKWPNGLTIDFEEDRIYWVDSGLNYIHSMDLNGSNRRLVKDGQLAHPFSITVSGNSIYWTDWRDRSILSCDKNDCSTIRTIETNIYSPMEIDAYGPSRQPRDVDTPCFVNNGGCSHLCLLAPAGSNICACPTGILLQSDNKTCYNEPSAAIFVARRYDLRMISLDTFDFSDVIINTRGTSQEKHAVAIDYDPISGYVYWTDDEVDLIRRVFRNGSHQETIVTNDVINPDGIAVDWVAKNIFWTDTDRIEVARLDGSNRKVLVDSGLDEPRAIKLDPFNGWIYWTDWGESPRIERCAMDGSRRSVIIDSQLGWPNGLALDLEEKKLYWADAKMDVIERSDYDGSNREIILDKNLPHVFGFSLLGEHVYWTDWQTRRMERMNKNNGEDRQVIREIPDLMTLRAVNLTVDKKAVTNACAVNDGGCSRLCLMTPDGHVCSCPTDMELRSDNKTCENLFLLFSQDSKKIRRTPISLANSTEIGVRINVSLHITGLDFDLPSSRLYFSDPENRSIRYTMLNGSTVQTVLEFTGEYPMSVKVDWLSSNLYFIDKNLNRIEVFNPTSNGRRVVVWKDTVNPQYLAVHPMKGYIFWIDCTWIGRANLDGSETKRIISQIGQASSIAIDFGNDLLYWINRDNNSIVTSDLDGNNQTTFLTNLIKPTSLAIYTNSLYWYDLQEECIKRTSLYMNQTNKTVIVQQSLQNVDTMLVYNSAHKLAQSNCSTENGGCEHLCFTQGEDYHCSCPTHYSLNSDGKTCSAPRNFMLMLERIGDSGKERQMTRIIDPKAQSEPSFMFPIEGLTRVRSPIFNTKNETVYWIQAGKSANIKWFELSSYQTGDVLGKSWFAPFSMVLDPVSQLIYWSDIKRNVIRVTRTTGESKGRIGDKSAAGKPRLLAILPHYERLLFFTTKKTNKGQTSYEITRYNLDGEYLVVIISNRTKIHSLITDIKGGQIYWAENMSIYTCDAGGNGIRTVVEGVQVNSMTVYEGNLYYAVLSNRFYYVKELRNDGTPACFPTQLKINQNGKEILGLYTVDERLDTGSHPCAENNGGCSHDCYINGKSQKQCGCPTGLVLDYFQQKCQPPPS